MPPKRVSKKAKEKSTTFTPSVKVKMEPIYKKLQQFAAIRIIAPDILRETMNKVDDIVLSSTYKKEKALEINRNITENMGEIDNLDTLIGILVLPTASPPPSNVNCNIFRKTSRSQFFNKKRRC